MSLKIDPATGYLPPGVHETTWSDVELLCGTNSHRQRLLRGLKQALLNLRKAGCKIVLLDGSFVSSKSLPNDYDGAWEPSGVDPDLIDEVLLTFDDGRAAMKGKYFGELFPATALAEAGVIYRDFFQKDRNGVPKGVLEIDLGSIV
jgi:hypothetical protein